MERELSLKRCKTCGKTVQILEDSNVEIMCCNEIMETIVPNSVDAAIEKHVPEYTVEDGKILVKSKSCNGRRTLYRMDMFSYRRKKNARNILNREK